MSEEESGEDLNLVTLLAIIILMIYTVAAPIFEKIHFHYNQYDLDIILDNTLGLKFFYVFP